MVALSLFWTMATCQAEAMLPVQTGTNTIWELKEQ